MQDHPPDRGQTGPRALTEFSLKVTRRHLGRRGFTEASLIADWPLIVGDRQAEGSLPVKIAFPPGERKDGVLHVRVVSGGLALEFSHREPLIVQRINSYFGYGAVIRLKITQGPVPPRRRPRPAAPPPCLTLEQEQAVQQRVAVIEDADLRDALARLGRQLAGRR